MTGKYKMFKSVAYLLITMCFSCANLEHINKFAHSSADGIQKAKDIPFSFNNFCYHFQQRALANTLQTKIAPLPKLDCQVYSNSDSALKIFNDVLLAYLQGLEKLSAKDLVDYDLSNAATNLQTLQGKVGWEVGDTEVTATKNIVTRLLNNVVNHYRKKQLKKILQGSQDDFKRVIAGYTTGLKALQGETKLALQNYRFFFSDSLLNATKESALKTLLVRDYHQQEDVFEKANQSIENYMKILNKIESGYIQLSNSSNRLTADDLKTALQKSVSDLKYLKAQMDDLKPTN